MNRTLRNLTSAALGLALGGLLAQAADWAYADGMPHDNDPCSKPKVKCEEGRPGNRPDKPEPKDDTVREVSEPGSAALLGTGLGLAAVVAGLHVVARRRKHPPDK